MNRYVPPASKSDTTAATELTTPFGSVQLLWYHQELAKIEFGGFEPAERRVSIRHFLPSHGEGQAIISQLTAYFKGEKVEFDAQLPGRAGSDSQRRVWEGLRGIPYGQCESYDDMAKRLGLPQRGARVLGNVCTQNPLPILFPSHRLLLPNGTLTGFVGGIKWRKALLELEGIQVDYDRVALPPSS
jgi:O-6-methylguanine DNA methyltransferase